MKFNRMNLSNVSSVVFKSTKFKVDEDSGNVTPIVKTVKWDRKRADSMGLGEDYRDEYAWICVNARIDGVTKDDHQTLGVVESDATMINRIKRLNNSPRYEFWFNSPTINIDKL